MSKKPNVATKPPAGGRSGQFKVVDPAVKPDRVTVRQIREAVKKVTEGRKDRSA